MLAPKKVKHRKVHRGSMAGEAKGNTEIHFGEFGLKAMDRCWLTANQIESARIAMTRHVKRGGKIWIRVFPDKSYTKKPAETRMGSGKGAPEGARGTGRGRKKGKRQKAKGKRQELTTNGGALSQLVAKRLRPFAFCPLPFAFRAQRGNHGRTQQSQGPPGAGCERQDG